MSLIITIDDLTTYMIGKTVDPGLGQQVVDAVNQFIENRTGRVWGETKQITERANWSKNLWLRNMDAVSIDTIKYGVPGDEQTTVDAGTYYLGGTGRVTMPWSGRNSIHENDYVEIVYTAGVVDVPDDLRMAALGLASNFYAWAENGQHDVSAVAVGSYKVEYTNKQLRGDAKPNPATSTSDANWGIIESYRMRRS